MSSILSGTELNIRLAADSLYKGNLVAFPTETVYGLGADATNRDAIERIYEVKARPNDHPLIVHLYSMQFLSEWAQKIPDYVFELARNFWPGPMTLVLPRKNIARDFITGGQNSVAIRIPANRFALALLKDFENIGGIGIAAPSANKFGKVSPTSAHSVLKELGPYLKSNDLILDGGNCEIGIESTIIDCTGTIPRILRPGSITSELIQSECQIFVQKYETIYNDSHIRVPGLLRQHYAPNAKVYLSRKPEEGDGLIALARHKTPMGVLRLAQPKDNEEFAKQLYAALRKADELKLNKVIVIPPLGEGIAVAIRDRLIRCATRTHIS
jgi:L-threonylcarbamoyladenylate synthase